MSAPSVGSVPRCLPGLGLGWARARTGSNPRGWQELGNMSPHCCWQSLPWTQLESGACPRNAGVGCGLHACSSCSFAIEIWLSQFCVCSLSDVSKWLLTNMVYKNLKNWINLRGRGGREYACKHTSKLPTTGSLFKCLHPWGLGQAHLRSSLPAASQRVHQRKLGCRGKVEPESWTQVLRHGM